MSRAAWNRLRKRVIACQRCPRLIEHCRQVAVKKRKAYQDQTYWGKPVPNFGTPNASLLVIGLAPGAHGANRTGRMFSGDRSGEWLYRAMFRAGFANQETASGKRDGLQLEDAVVTNVGRCAPPDNKPTTEELSQCAEYFLETIELAQPTVFLALGSLAWRSTILALIELGWMEKPKRRPAFGHAAKVELLDGRLLLGSYHPSQQNTFTGRLTETMLDDIFAEARNWIS